MDESSQPRRYTIWVVILMPLASLLALGIGYVGIGMWLANAMTFASALNAEPTNYAAWAGYLFLNAGPVFAGAGLVLGWLSFIFFRAPRAGLRLVFFLPIIWAVAVLAYIAIVATICSGDFICGL